ncbi:1001_t:CDS:2 [Cetraspora pellucida]|uniref:1001_t:CDS:1 n=1 Tax=Cetraspora pellucida TaxID=1433469 RepID=A0ACA9MBJ9_9GLOM|nr:1001_t:CDS:2 [Cetraspora pellucida]
MRRRESQDENIRTLTNHDYIQLSDFHQEPIRSFYEIQRSIPFHTVISNNSSKYGDYFSVNFEDITVYTSSNDLTNLYIGMIDKNQGVIISLNIDVHRKLFEDINWGFGAKKMSMLPNAGGQSELSEILSCEIVERILGVELDKTEMEIDYFFMNQPMTDYLVSNRNLSQFALGVSVTRAFSYRRRYTKHDAYRLLSKKLSGINSSTRNILNVRIWKQILHIWCPSGRVANIVRKVYSKLPKEFTSNTIVMLTVVNCKWYFEPGIKSCGESERPILGG